MGNGGKHLLSWLNYSHFIYAMALIASAAILNGITGVIIACCILAFWFLRSWFTPTPYSPHTLEMRISILAFFTIGIVSIYSLYTCLAGEPFSGKHHYTHFPYGENGLMPKAYQAGPKLGPALLAYQRRHGNFPPAFLADADGNPMHSWRVLLLPYLGQNEVYKRYRFDEPWDGPNNSKLVDAIPPSIFSWKLKTMATTKLVTGPQTIYPDHRKAHYSPGDCEVPPVLAIEDTENPVCWMKPEDLTVDQALKIFDREASPEAMLHLKETYYWVYDFYIGSIMDAEGKCHMAGHLDNPEVLRPYFSVAEEPQVRYPNAVSGYVGIPFDFKETTKTLRIEHCLLLGANIFLALFPIAWRRT